MAVQRHECQLTKYLQFEAESAEGHSSSIVDLFESLRSPINFLQELEWDDEYQEGRFFTSLSKVRPFNVKSHPCFPTATVDGFQSSRAVLPLNRRAFPDGNVP